MLLEEWNFSLASGSMEIGKVQCLGAEKATPLLYNVQRIMYVCMYISIVSTTYRESMGRETDSSFSLPSKFLSLYLHLMIVWCKSAIK
jgi:hypothetical protein